MRSVAAKLGVGTTETVRKWIRRAEVDAGSLTRTHRHPAQNTHTTTGNGHPGTHHPSDRNTNTSRRTTRTSRRRKHRGRRHEPVAALQAGLDPGSAGCR